MSDLQCNQQDDLNCPKFNAAFFVWLNTLKNKVYEICTCLNEILSFTCEPVLIKDASIVGQSFVREDFDFIDVNPQTVQSTGAMGLTINVADPNLTLIGFSLNRVSFEQINPSNPASGLVTFTFTEDICDFKILVRDPDVPIENLTGWSKTPDSIVPPFAPQVESVVTITEVNSNTVTVNYQTAIGATISIYIVEVTTCAPCFPANKCTNSIGTVKYEDANGVELSGNYIDCSGTNSPGGM